MFRAQGRRFVFQINTAAPQADNRSSLKRPLEQGITIPTQPRALTELRENLVRGELALSADALRERVDVVLDRYNSTAEFAWVSATIFSAHAGVVRRDILPGPGESA